MNRQTKTSKDVHFTPPISKVYNELRTREPIVVGPAMRKALHDIIDGIDPHRLSPIGSTVFQQALRFDELRSVVETYFDTLIATEPFSPIVDRLNSTPERRIVFFARRPSFAILRQATHLRERGWHCPFIHLEPFPDPLKDVVRESFDEVIELPNNLMFFEAFVRALRDVNLHMQTLMKDCVTTATAIRARRNGTRVVADFMDVTSLFADRDTLLGFWPEDEVDLELESEGAVFTSADAVLTRFDPPAWSVLRDLHGELTKVQQFFPYPSPQFGKPPEGKRNTDGPLRVVHAGGLVPPGDSSTAPGMLPTLRSLASQGFEVTVYHDPMRPLAQSVGLEPYFALAEEFSNFHLRDGVPPNRLQEVFAQQDYGLWLTAAPKSYYARPQLRDDGHGTKNFAYMEAGLPVIVSAEYKAMAAYVERHGTGLGVKTEDIPQLRETLDRIDLEGLRDNVRAFCETHSMRQKISQIEAIYEGTAAFEGAPAD